MIAISRRLLLANLLGSALLASGCEPAADRAGDLSIDERRLLPQIIRRQEQRVRSATQDLATAQDEAVALRLRQRMLLQHGRPDLAAGLEPQAAEKEDEVRRLRQRLADEEAALAAYRDYASHVGLRAAVPSGGGGEPATATRHDGLPPGSP